MRRLDKTKKQQILRVIVVLCIVVAAGPEIWAGAELIGIVDLLGVELFLFMMFNGVLWRIRAMSLAITRFLERTDPYFFVPTRRLISQYPGIVVHAIPFLVGGCIVGYIVTDGNLADRLS